MKLSNNQTETEQLYEKMTDKAEEQTQEPEEVEISEQAEQEQDEIVDDEQLEIEREIAEYATKIEALDAKIEEYRSRRITDDKREAMRKYHYTDEQIDRYIKFIDGETSEEIEQSIVKLAEDIAPKGDNFADPSPMNHAKQKPTPADPGEVGKTLFNRIKNKVFPR